MQAFIYRHDINAEDTVWISNFHFLDDWVKNHCAELSVEGKHKEFTINPFQLKLLRNVSNELSNSVLDAFSAVFNTHCKDECEANDMRAIEEERLNMEVGFEILDTINAEFYTKLRNLVTGLDFLLKQNTDRINYTYYVSY